MGPAGVSRTPSSPLPWATGTPRVPCIKLSSAQALHGARSGRSQDRWPPAGIRLTPKAAPTSLVSRPRSSQSRARRASKSMSVMPQLEPSSPSVSNSKPDVTYSLSLLVHTGYIPPAEFEEMYYCQQRLVEDEGLKQISLQRTQGGS